MWIAVPALVVAVAFNVYRILLFHLPIVQFSLVLVGAVVVAIAVFEVFFFFAIVREVRLFADRVEFVSGVLTTPVPWENLAAPLGPLRVVITFCYRPDGVTVSDRGFPVNRELARAILSYPACPRLDLNPKILRSLGYSANPTRASARA
jgi:hypothetical protein